MKILIVVDANPIISALIGGVSRDIFFSKMFRFATSEHTVGEVRKFIPYISKKSGVDDAEIERALAILPLRVYERDGYGDKIKAAAELIGPIDEHDVDILALSLKLNAPLWTNDKDFDGVKKITVVKTKDLI